MTAPVDNPKLEELMPNLGLSALFGVLIVTD
jgi:hypothetical protein